MSAIATVATALQVAGGVKAVVDSINTGEAGAAGKAAARLGRDFVRSDSLISYTKTTRVEPIVLLDQRAVFLPYIQDTLQVITSIFSGYYLQAVALNANVGSVNVLKTLDKLNPSRSTLTFSGESFADKLPDFGLEAESSAVSFGRDAVGEIKEATNLAVGKMLEVKLVSEGQTFTIPVSVRLLTNMVDSQSLVHILGVGKDNKSFKARWHGWRSGQLDFVRDLILCQDLIEEHRKTLMNDKSGVYSEIMKRRNHNAAAMAISGEVSVATASNIAVITHQTAKEVENAVGGRLKDPKVRERIFKDSYLMLLVVIDTEFEQVAIYHRGIALPTELSVKELKISNRGSGPDVAEILKAYQLGNSISL